MECVGLALAIPPVVAGLLRVIKHVNNMRARLQTMPATVALILAQCSTMNVVLRQLQHLDISRAVPHEQERAQLLQDTEIIIEGCKEALTQLEDILLDSCETEEGDPQASSIQMGKKARIMLVRQDGRIKDLLSQLSSYHSSILILLTTTQCQKLDIMQCDIETLLEHNAESLPKQKSAPNVVEVESLNWGSIASDEVSTTAINWDRESRGSSSVSFEFDPIIADSRIYQRTLASEGPQKYKQFKSMKTMAPSNSMGGPECSQRPEKLMVHITDSVDVETSEPVGRSEGLSHLIRSPKNIRTPRRTDGMSSFTFKARRRTSMQNTSAIKLGTYSKTYMKAQQFPLELVVTGPGGDKLSLVTSLAKQRTRGATKISSMTNHSFHIIDGRTVFVHVVDTPLHDDHYLVRELFIKPAHGFMLVYDVACRASYEKLMDYRKQLLVAKGLSSKLGTAKHAPMLLVGNNMDCGDERQVFTEEGRNLAELFGCLHIETSSLAGIHIEQAFTQIVRAVQKS